ncbi:MAG: hypothetical protein ABL993_11405 [Vicinamibacterales bacterium]
MNNSDWRSDAAFVCFLSLSPVISYTLQLPVQQVGMLVAEPTIYAPGSSGEVPMLIEPSVSSTGVSSILASHAIQAFDIWK